MERSRADQRAKALKRPAGAARDRQLGESPTKLAVKKYLTKIVNGAKPAEQPVMQSIKFELIINLKTARMLGFEFLPTFSARADEVIE
jgi:hypothetical protein